MKGTVFNIQRFSIHDGPGIRTTVFLKGCSLRCFWCHNPESLSAKRELQMFPEKCIGCGQCFSVCLKGAHEMTGEGRVFHRERCTACGRCVELCYAEALVMAGEEMDVDEVVDEVMKDEDFYRNSGGGVTLSGGEPLLQPEFCREILARCKDRGIHTAIETAAFVDWKAFEKVMDYTDLFLVDIKLMDAVRHREVTGATNEKILDNIKRLRVTAIPQIIRIPVVPGINDNEGNMEETAVFLQDFPNLEYVELLKFHKMAVGKYQSLDRPYRAEGLEPLNPDRMEELGRLFSASGIRVKVDR
ncbi:MAG: glycyl-radical enzyme activating protein [Clostridia bacterium]|jgi:pyruvate formate lyase activating enzyme